MAALEAMEASPYLRETIHRQIYKELSARYAEPVEVSDVIYVRHGASGVRLALVVAIGAGKTAGSFQVAAWSDSGERFMSLRRVSALDFRGWPDDLQRMKIEREAARAAK